MSIFDNINQKINNMAVGDDEISISSRSSGQFSNAESIFSNQARAQTEPNLDLGTSRVPAPDSVASGTIANPSLVMRRYRDAYMVAKFNNGVGRLVKNLGIGIALLIALFHLLGAFWAAQSAGGAVALGVFIWGLLLGVFIGSIFYVWGIVLSAQGQMLMASLDGAVCGSPFLTDEQKAWAMGVQL